MVDETRPLCPARRRCLARSRAPNLSEAASQVGQGPIEATDLQLRVGLLAEGERPGICFQECFRVVGGVYSGSTGEPVGVRPPLPLLPAALTETLSLTKLLISTE